MALVITRERLHECSDKFRKSMEVNGITLESSPESVAIIGRHVMDLVIPELSFLYSTSLGVTAESVVQQHEGEQRPRLSAEFTGNLSRIQISEVVIEQPGKITVPKPDILLVFSQKITDSDPVDLGYSDEILVLMSEMDSLRLAP